MKIKINKLDRLFSLYIRAKAGWNCQKCGGHYDPPTKALHTHHVFSRANFSVRYDEVNCYSLCYGCHRYAHREPLEFYEWVKTKIGDQRFELLRIKSKLISKRSQYDALGMEIWLKQELEKMKI